MRNQRLLSFILSTSFGLTAQAEVNADLTSLQGPAISLAQCSLISRDNSKLFVQISFYQAEGIAVAVTQAGSQPATKRAFVVEYGRDRSWDQYSDIDGPEVFQLTLPPKALADGFRFPNGSNAILSLADADGGIGFNKYPMLCKVHNELDHY